MKLAEAGLATAYAAAAGLGSVAIRPACVSDLADLVTLVGELAVYERLEDQAVATEADLARGLFGTPPKAHALMVETDGAIAGFAVYFYTFSTFVGRASLYIEDIFIRPEFRRRGFGLAVFRQLARQAAAEGCGRMEWSVLDWNRPALDFYAALGAVPMTDWTVQRLSGFALNDFSKG